MSEEQSEIQYVPMPQQESQGVPMPFRNDRAELIDKINPATVVETARRMLLGEEFNGSTWFKVPALQESSLTEVGAWKIASELHGIANLATSVSKYDTKLITGRLQRMSYNILVQLIGNWRKFGVKNVAMFYSVHNLMRNIAMAVLYQAGGGSIQELLGTIKSENTNIQTEQQKPGLLRRMLGRT